MVGPAIAPLCGGLATHYASWRYAQWFLFIMGVSAFVPVALWLPETLDPDQLNKSKGRLNPLASLALLRSPNVLLPVSHSRNATWCLSRLMWFQSIAGATGLICDFGRSALPNSVLFCSRYPYPVMMIPVSYTIVRPLRPLSY